MCLPSERRDKVEMKFAPKGQTDETETATETATETETGRGMRGRLTALKDKVLTADPSQSPSSQNIRPHIRNKVSESRNRADLKWNASSIPWPELPSWLIYCTHLNWPLVKECIS